MFSVCSYNILSSHLSSPSHFHKSKEENLLASNRIAKCIDKINTEVAKNSIICLQEVSLTYLNNIHTFFCSKNYHVIDANYGNPYNDYMGVSLAFPTSKFSLLDLSVIRVADTKKKFKPKYTLLQQYLNKISDFFLSFLKFFNLYKQPYNLLNDVTNRSNRLICAKLLDKETNKEFVISNYHMPCNFTKPNFMNVHSSLVAQYVEKYANGIPYIIAGDFNILPNSTTHKLLLSGTIDKSDPYYPNFGPEDNWEPTFTPLRSAYKEKNGEEPDFTNWAEIVSNPEPFIGTLDYLFYSKDIEVVDTLPLPSREEVGCSLPNDTEGSDHIMISASFNITN